ncbi:BTAD domain-containing putative transcriptional regulator [Arthrobacter crystallopoietes]|uniref:AfsR/SARP family transcriptional regulator n=1 Tax=Crystallibacter crystallopoietes TaxID=37928 RepID=UPI003D1E6243
MAANTWQLQLIDGWRLRSGGRDVKVGLRQQRLIAALALLGSQPRPYLSGLLWPESSEKQASGSLRAAVWTISQQLPGLLVSDNLRLGLAQSVHVDVSDFLLDTAGATTGVTRGNRLDLRGRADLLPGWYDDWVLEEQEQFQRRRLSALETMAENMLARGETPGALDAAWAALRIDPLAGNAMRLLLRAQLQEGNHAGVLSAYRDFSLRMRNEFGARLPADITAIVSPLLSRAV